MHTRNSHIDIYKYIANELIVLPKLMKFGQKLDAVIVLSEFLMVRWFKMLFYR